MIHVAFINENTLGHGSYLGPFVRWFGDHPELGIRPHVIDAVPLPPHLRWGDWSVRGLRRFGLDFGATRWRLAASRHAREQFDRLRNQVPLGAVVVNTQSVGLALHDLPAELPLFVCLDATFRQLAHSPWFAGNSLTRVLNPLLLRVLYSRERQLFGRATRLFPWSRAARQSLLDDYGLDPQRVNCLPPSLSLPAAREHRSIKERPQILFVGGDFHRKGGADLLECYRKHLKGRYELHLLTQSSIPEEEGVHVHRGVAAYSEAWWTRWQQADVFVFPSRLETFGIVLLEAMAFGVPIVASTAGAARELLGDGDAGILLERIDAGKLAEAIESVFHDGDATRQRVQRARRRVETDYDLPTNARRLAGEICGALERGARTVCIHTQE